MSNINIPSQINRDILWPGNQINDITKFREDCYRKCHEQNPTNDPWFERNNQCGLNCKRKLKEFEYKQGKNPCELRLQAPVFWNNNDIVENFEVEDKKNNSINIIYIILLIILIILICVSIFLQIYKSKSRK